MLSFTHQLLVASCAVAIIPQVLGHAQLYFTGPNFISRASDLTMLTQEGLTGIFSALLNVKPVDDVDSSVSQQVKLVVSRNVCHCQSASPSSTSFDHLDLCADGESNASNCVHAS